MLFRKKIEKSCQYCAFGTVLEDGSVLCSKRGVVSETVKCRKFRYDPCKRIPSAPKPMDFSRYKNDDFSL